MNKRNIVSISVDKKFFSNVFEPSRRKLQAQLGTKITQPVFTRMLTESGMKLDLKLNTGGKNAFLPKKQKR